MLKGIFNATMYPRELRAILKLKYWVTGIRSPYADMSIDEVGNLESRDFCYAILHKVSRSFASVIQQLPLESRDAICAFYLVLRGLDTIEDDMSIDDELKRKMLVAFYKNNHAPDWNFHDLEFEHEGYRLLLSNYNKVSAFYRSLDPMYQEVIEDICKRMGAGMAEFSDKEILTEGDYDLYCHYVAGLVGVGLSAIFARSGLEAAHLENMSEQANAMGLFLQKTNITRDIHEDLLEARVFWPRSIWNPHVNNVNHLIVPAMEGEGLQAVNEMVLNALEHMPDCIEYLVEVQNKMVFRFCAIPQVMAIATLNEVYNNPDTLKKNVKIRKGMAARLMLETNNVKNVRTVFRDMLIKITSKVPLEDPNRQQTLDRLDRIWREIDARYRQANENQRLEAIA